MTTALVPHLVGGVRLSATGTTQHTIFNPATGAELGRVPLDALDAADAAVSAAAAAFPAWSETPVGERVQCLFRYKAILEARADEVARVLVAEHGKTMGEARGSVRRGIDCVEHACAAPVLMMGRTLPQIAVSSSFCRTAAEGGVGIDSSVDRLPLGGCVGITPVNFPVMVPL